MRSDTVQARTLLTIMLACFCFAGSAASAADLVIGGTVTRVSNTSSGPQNFAILVTGGSLNTCGSNWINFPASAAADVEVHKRAFAIAVVALTTGLTVRVHNYQGSGCDVASYIELQAS